MTAVEFLVYLVLSVVGACLAIWIASKPKAVGALLVAAVFINRPYLSIGNTNVRLEIIVGLVCVLSLLIRSSLKRFKVSRYFAWSALLIFFWAILLSLSSIFVSPNPGSSLNVLIWLVLNICCAIWIAVTPSMWRTLIRWVADVGLVAGGIAVICYLAATVTSAEIYGVQADPAYGGFAAYGLSLEANVLGNIMCLLGLLAICNPANAISPLAQRLLPILAPVAILCSHTRAALVSYLVGLVLTLLMKPQVTRRVLAVMALSAAGVGFLFAISPDVGFAKFSQPLNLETGTGALRYDVNASALVELFGSDYMLTGLGLNSFGQRHLDETQPGKNLPGYLGNLPLQLAYDGGLVAIVIVGISVVAVSYGLMKKGGGRTFLVLGSAYLLFSISTSTLWLLQTWYFVGLGWASLQPLPTCTIHGSFRERRVIIT
ncbi:O-antigen ligase family protein [Sinomonas sp. R1AF57]|uniref:O-antigen ligase family protein n=1 Tax=Sinomonas sp. R1AF57 TaxID=2020377 RepID=UPI001ABF21AC|nr:O-antigen ligase family protein [Sinomonas sp. R1AF57]